jgi:hypothetical protein
MKREPAPALSSSLTTASLIRRKRRVPGGNKNINAAKPNRIIRPQPIRLQLSDFLSVERTQAKARRRIIPKKLTRL